MERSNIGLNAATIGLYVRGYAYAGGAAGSQIVNGQGDGVSSNLSLVREKAYTPGVRFEVIRGWPQPAWHPSNPSVDGNYNTYGYYSQYDTLLHYKGFLVKWIFTNP